MSTDPTFGWPVPADDDPLADGAAAIRDLAAAVAATIAGAGAAGSGAFVGEVRMAAIPAPPPGWLACDGSPIPAEYPDLIGLIGADTPNFTDRVPMGGGTLRATGGANTRTVPVPPHTHTVNHSHLGSVTGSGGAHTHVLSMTGAVSNNLFPPQGQGSGSVSGTSSAPIASAAAHTHTMSVPSFSGASGSTGTTNSLDTTPAHMRLGFFIYAGQQETP